MDGPASARPIAANGERVRSSTRRARRWPTRCPTTSSSSCTASGVRRPSGALRRAATARRQPAPRDGGRDRHGLRGQADVDPADAPLLRDPHGGTATSASSRTTRSPWRSREPVRPESQFRMVWEYDAGWGRPLVNRELFDGQRPASTRKTPTCSIHGEVSWAEFAGADHRRQGPARPRPRPRGRLPARWTGVRRDRRARLSPTEPRIIRRMAEAEARTGLLTQSWVLGPEPMPSLDDLLDARDRSRHPDAAFSNCGEPAHGVTRRSLTRRPTTPAARPRRRSSAMGPWSRRSSSR